MSTNESLNKILEMAISREQAANDFYLSVSKRVQKPASKELFEKLAGEELRHKKLLVNLKFDPKLTSMFKPQADFKVAESEHTPVITPEMSLKDSIALAMKKEEQAAKLYGAMAKAAATDEVRQLFENLMNMEAGHKLNLENLFVDVAYPEVF